MKMMVLVIIALMVTLTVSIVSAYQLETTSFSVEKTNTGLAASNFDTPNYSGRNNWDYNQPSSLQGSTTLYFLHPGYFQAITGEIPVVGAIELVIPENNLVTNNAIIEFVHSTEANASINSCNLLVWRGSTLNINNTAYNVTPGTNYSWGSMPFPEDDYTWKVTCDSISGNTSESPLNSFAIDLTAPAGTINNPLDGETEPNTATFEIDIDELHPGQVIITVGNISENYNYTNGTNNFNMNIPDGIYNWSATITDAAGNNITLPTQEILINGEILGIIDYGFNPDPGLHNEDLEAYIEVSGGVQTAIVSMKPGSYGWTNYTILTATGSDPYTYIKELSNSWFGIGDLVQAKWYLEDNLGIWTETPIYNTTIKSGASGGSSGTGGSWPKTKGEVSIIPEKIFVDSLKGIEITIKNNGTRTCQLTKVNVKETIGSDLQDRFSVKNIELGSDFNLDKDEEIKLLLKPTGITGIVGNGELIVETEDCGTATAEVTVNIIFGNIIIDTINNGADNVVNFFGNMINYVEGIL